MKRILIVEDQPDIRKLIRMTLEFEDYEIHEASDGAFGLRMAQLLKPGADLLSGGIGFLLSRHWVYRKT